MKKLAVLTVTLAIFGQRVAVCGTLVPGYGADQIEGAPRGRYRGGA